MCVDLAAVPELQGRLPWLCGAALPRPGGRGAAEDGRETRLLPGGRRQTGRGCKTGQGTGQFRGEKGYIIICYDFPVDVKRAT